MNPSPEEKSIFPNFSGRGKAVVAVLGPIEERVLALLPRGPWSGWRPSAQRCPWSLSTCSVCHSPSKPHFGVSLNICCGWCRCFCMSPRPMQPCLVCVEAVHRGRCLRSVISSPSCPPMRAYPKSPNMVVSLNVFAPPHSICHSAPAPACARARLRFCSGRPARPMERHARAPLRPHACALQARW